MNIIKKLFKTKKKSIAHDVQQEICNCPACGAAPEVDHHSNTSWENYFEIFCSKRCGFRVDCRVDITIWGDYFIVDSELWDAVYKQLIKSWNKKIKSIKHE